MRRNEKKVIRFQLGALISAAIGLMSYAIIMMMSLTGAAFVGSVLILIVCFMGITINTRNGEIHALCIELDDVTERITKAGFTKTTKSDGRLTDAYWDAVRATDMHAKEHDFTRTALKAQIRDLNLNQRDAYYVREELAAMEKRQLIPIHMIRIGHAERDQVIETLGNHYAAGRLDRTEFDTRMDKAGQAKTAIELADLLTDLPRDLP